MTERWQRRLEKLDAVGPSTNLLERAKEGPQHKLPPGSSPWARIGVALVALTVAAASIVVAIRAFGSDGGPPVSGEPSTYTDPLGWAIGVPDGWYVIPVDLQLRVSVDGAMFSSVPLPIPTVRIGETSAGFTDYPPVTTKLPRDAVVLSVTHMEGGPFFLAAKNDSRFPLALDDFEVVSTPDPFGPRVLDFQAVGLRYTALAWVGPEATPADRAELTRMVDSIRFPELEPYTTTDGYFVLDLPEAYPIGTVQRFGPDDFVGTVSWGRVAPFFLVHDRRGFYTLGLEDQSGSWRQFRYDSDRQLIVYREASNEWAWDLAGRQVEGPGGKYRFPIHSVIRAWDGHLLTAPNTSFPSVAAALKRP